MEKWVSRDRLLYVKSSCLLFLRVIQTDEITKIHVFLSNKLRTTKHSD